MVLALVEASFASDAIFELPPPEVREITYDNGSKYYGEVYENYPDGEGEMIFFDGFLYRGNFLLGAMHGNGELFSNNGCFSYKGDFNNDALHGFGELLIEESMAYKGNFELNKPIGDGECKCNGDTFYADFYACIESCAESNGISRECCEFYSEWASDELGRKREP